MAPGAAQPCAGATGGQPMITARQLVSASACSLLLWAISCGKDTPVPPPPAVDVEKAVPLVRAPSGPLRLWSPAFTEGESIPSRYTCEGEDQTPPLFWRGVPPATRSLALIIDDPDAPDPAVPRMTWVHWVLLRIPIAATGLTSNAEHSGLPAGTIRGLNSWKRTHYGGPCPPVGRHRYYHRLYALDVDLASLERPSKDQLTAAMEGHILSSATLMGTYIKQEKPPAPPPAALSPAVSATGSDDLLQ